MWLQSGSLSLCPPLMRRSQSCWELLRLLSLPLLLPVTGGRPSLHRLRQFALCSRRLQMRRRGGLRRPPQLLPPQLLLRRLQTVSRSSVRSGLREQHGRARRQTERRCGSPSPAVALRRREAALPYCSLRSRTPLHAPSLQPWVPPPTASPQAPSQRLRRTTCRCAPRGSRTHACAKNHPHPPLQILQNTEYLSRAAPELVAARCFLVGLGRVEPHSAAAEGKAACSHPAGVMAALRGAVRCGVARPDPATYDASIAAAGGAGAYQAAMRLPPASTPAVCAAAASASSSMAASAGSKRPRPDEGHATGVARSSGGSLTGAGSAWELRMSRSTGAQYWYSAATAQSLWHDAALPAGWAFERSAADSPKTYVSLLTGHRQSEPPTASLALAGSGAA